MIELGFGTGVRLGGLFFFGVVYRTGYNAGRRKGRAEPRDPWGEPDPGCIPVSAWICSDPYCPGHPECKPTRWAWTPPMAPDTLAAHEVQFSGGRSAVVYPNHVGITAGGFETDTISDV